MMADLRNIIGSVARTIGPAFPGYLETQQAFHQQRLQDEEMALNRQRVEQALALAQAEEQRAQAQEARAEALFEAQTTPRYYTEGVPGPGEAGPMPQARSLLDIQAQSAIESLFGAQQERGLQARQAALLGGLPEVNLGEVGLPGVQGRIPALGLSTYAPLIGLTGTRERIATAAAAGGGMKPQTQQLMYGRAYARHLAKNLRLAMPDLDEDEKMMLASNFGDPIKIISLKHPKLAKEIESETHLDTMQEVEAFRRGEYGPAFQYTPVDTTGGAVVDTTGVEEIDPLLRYVETGEGEEELFGGRAAKKKAK